MAAGITVLRRPSLTARIGRSRSSLYADIKAGLFVSPIRLGDRAVGWLANEVDAIMRARIAGKNDDEIRALVLELEAARKVVA